MTIVGAAPPEFRGVQAVIDVQGYLPLGMLFVEGKYERELLTLRSRRMFKLVGRLQGAGSLPQAQGVLQIAGRELGDRYPTLAKGMTMDAQPEALSRIHKLKLMTVFDLLTPVPACGR